MDRSQLLIYGLLIVGFLLFNFLLRRAAKRAREQQEHERAQQEELAPSPADEPIEYGWGRGPQADRQPAALPVEPARRFEMNPAAPPLPLHRPAPRALFRSRNDLRRAIVVMTVLGPCRALEPHDRH